MDCAYPGCSKRCSSKYNLERHYKTLHLKIRPHLCQFCFRSFASKQNRLTHEYIHRTPVPEPIPATVPHEAYVTQIEPLTALLTHCRDPDLHPFAKVQRIYYWPEEACGTKLPAIQSQDRSPSLA